MQTIKETVLSYDIACQYSRNFEERFTASPDLEMPCCSLTFAVPKFHLPAHKDVCRYFYSFNYLKNVGRTDGEAIERFWSRHNLLSGSTRRMSPETRIDTLNAHFSDWNWRKLCAMGMCAAVLAPRIHTYSAQEKHYKVVDPMLESRLMCIAHGSQSYVLLWMTPMLW